MTRYDPAKHHRRSIRLKWYDYTRGGAYFVTLVTQNRECLLGTMADGEMRLSDAGRMVRETWAQMGNRFSNVESDTHIVMPNHFHGILLITGDGTSPVGTSPVGTSPVGAPLVGAPNTTGSSTRDDPTRTTSLGEIIGAFKSITTVEYIRGVRNLGWTPFHKRLWQRNYYERIVRDDHELDNVRQYIFDNPARWSEDAENEHIVRNDRE